MDNIVGGDLLYFKEIYFQITVKAELWLAWFSNDSGNFKRKIWLDGNEDQTIFF